MYSTKIYNILNLESLPDLDLLLMIKYIFLLFIITKIIQMATYSYRFSKHKMLVAPIDKVKLYQKKGQCLEKVQIYCDDNCANLPLSEKNTNSTQTSSSQSLSIDHIYCLQEQNSDKKQAEQKWKIVSQKNGPENLRLFSREERNDINITKNCQNSIIGQPYQCQNEKEQSFDNMTLSTKQEHYDQSSLEKINSIISPNIKLNINSIVTDLTINLSVNVLQRDFLINALQKQSSEVNLIQKEQNRTIKAFTL